MPKFTATLPGPPFSTNHIYTIARGSRRIVKAAGVEQYQTNVAYVIRLAKPRDFAPEGQVRMRFGLFLDRDMDADNALKMLIDAICAALNINDSRVLPCVLSKVTHASDPRVEVEIEW